VKSLFKKSWRVKRLDAIEETIRAFSPAERAAFIATAIVFAASVFWIFIQINNLFLVDVPAHGGSFSEAIVGTPRFANPLLAVSDSDRDLSALVYSGLMRQMPDGSVIPDLASSYSVSTDTLTYTFNIRSDAAFQDGTPVTADDVAFTVLKAEDPALKSPEAANWNGVSVKVIDPKEISFTLKQPYAFFIDDTTLGILPKHIWQNVSDDNFAFSDYNTKPVGSGPYAVSSISRDSSGVPTGYLLSAFNGFTLGTPYIENISLKIFADDASALDALKKGEVGALAGVNPSDMPIAVKGARTIVAPFTRVFGLFFNQNRNALFADHAIRTALDESAPRDAIVKSVLNGFGLALTGPLVSSGMQYSASTSASSLSLAMNTLARDGWTESSTTGMLMKTSKKSSTPLSFSISTGDVPELAATANILKDAWKSLGAEVDVKVFDQSDLAQSVVQTRSYDALLLGMVVGRHPDLYAFWDSSQRNYPGLNVAEYTNAKADKVLADMRTTSDPVAQTSDENKFLSYVASDTPAVFLYSPDFIYAVPESIRDISVGPITIAADRFENVWQWYIDTEKVWSGFVQNNN
jgi:peptide/nickel transport system substrate-binding protein